jgi:hypothetical protein
MMSAPLGRGPQLRRLREQQHTTLGARMLDRGAQQRVDQFLQDDLAPHGLRHLEHGGEIKILDRRPDRRGRPGSSRLVAQLRI